ncbi:protein-disulfide reductase DsbD family protein [Flavobacterium suncheonense]|uniref:Thiol:disulfide interchange protein DsbD n=1 Tax=Flavobacterium suncheonense GH29-5 = DSM 17707 TaxID=1121899 RepID=A0A0A2M3I1_9FLAO|nr:thioredoxin family protein [Flavobacterium suncheonense]KGO87157.1 thiol:disulfide interchange protein DsbD [Flavobacterium suncheonense GH29-5 = DSM 17707]
MKRFYALLLLFFTFLSVQAQILDPVSWRTSVEKKSDTEVVLVFDASIEHEWHMFSQFTPEGGSLPTVFEYKNAKGNFELVGKTKESPYKKVYSDIFEVDEYMFEGKAQFKQTVKITNPNLKSISVYVEYQVCKESCIQQDKTFEFKLPPMNVKASEVAVATTSVDTDSAQTAVVQDSVSSSDVKKAVASAKTATNGKKEEKKDGLSLFFMTLLAGILVTFTPCVFPMIPMTVSFFLKQSAKGNTTKGKLNALFYGLFIIAIYVLISVPFHLIEGLSPDIFYEISTNVYLNLFFFAVFVIFAISFLGAFEITMPSSLANKADNASNLGGIVGVFFMALTLIIVSFSCTGPALGLVIGSVLSTDGGATLLTIAMLGFGVGLALPFMLFALFPSLMGNLPKSGGWLNTVKVVFGFIELALAFKFLSMADLVMQWHLLEREIFLAIMIAIFIGLSLYMFGKISLPHDSPINNISVGRLLIGLVSLSFTIYLIPGLWGAPLNLISGFPPPMTYSESPYGVGSSKGGGTSENHSALPEGAHYGPHDIVAFKDYKKGMAYAKSVNKPVLLDFTGNTCANCRRMEELVWSKPEILPILKDKVVLISLYVDSQEPLPENEKYTNKNGKEITTYGKKWSDLAITKYEANVQPYYVLMDLDENNLIKPVGYTPEISEYKTWLESGIAKFKK